MEEHPRGHSPLLPASSPRVSRSFYEQAAGTMESGGGFRHHVSLATSQTRGSDVKLNINMTRSIPLGSQKLGARCVLPLTSDPSPLARLTPAPRCQGAPRGLREGCAPRWTPTAPRRRAEDVASGVGLSPWRRLLHSGASATPLSATRTPLACTVRARLSTVSPPSGGRGPPSPWTVPRTRIPRLPGTGRTRLRLWRLSPGPTVLVTCTGPRARLAPALHGRFWAQALATSGPQRGASRPTRAAGQPTSRAMHPAGPEPRRHTSRGRSRSVQRCSVKALKSA